MSDRTLEERIARLEKQVHRLTKGRRPRDDGKQVWGRLESLHLEKWINQGGNPDSDDHTRRSKDVNKNVQITPDEFEDLIEYLDDRQNKIPYTATADEIVITVDRGTIRATMK